MQMYVTYNYVILYDNIQYAYYTKFYLSVCSTPFIMEGYLHWLFHTHADNAELDLKYTVCMLCTWVP